MSDTPTIVVLYGGAGGEREISLASGQAVIAALEPRYDVHGYDIQRAEIPAFVDAQRMIAFPVLHGKFGENGQLQQALDAAGIDYAGCGPEASALCMDKVRAKRKAAALGVEVAASVLLDTESWPAYSVLAEELGDSFVVKPVDEGSSVGLHLVDAERDFLRARGEMGAGQWMAESRVRGHEVSVGVLDGRALGVVGIRPDGGVYDFQRKYTAGASQYELPAQVPEAVRRATAEQAEAIFAACGCRDFSRIDFIVNGRNEPVFLEVNTLPGLTPTSLLPKSAQIEGLDFDMLLERMLDGAVKRWRQRHE